MLPGTNRAVRPLRAPVLLHQRGQRNPPTRARGGDGVQRHAQRQRADRHQDSGPAEHCRHAVADRHRPEEQGLLLSGHQQPQHRLGEAGRPRLQEGSGPRKLQLDGNPDSPATRPKTSSRPNCSSSWRPTTERFSCPERIACLPEKEAKLQSHLQWHVDLVTPTPGPGRSPKSPGASCTEIIGRCGTCPCGARRVLQTGGAACRLNVRGRIENCRGHRIWRRSQASNHQTHEGIASRSPCAQDLSCQPRHMRDCAC